MPTGPEPGGETQDPGLFALLLDTGIFFTSGIKNSIGNGVLTAEFFGRNANFGFTENAGDLFGGETLLHG